MKKKISVLLDESSTKALDSLKKEHECTISDIINAAIILLKKENKITFEKRPRFNCENMFSESKFKTIGAWCEARNINPERAYYVLDRINNNHRIYGYGNTKNKWRDKRDGRMFKTHTAWIAHCLEEDFGMEIL